ncbi:MAG: flagellar filament capping protein FliD [Epsilonproteobacteria bacterium]|nr:flagellar filament capping protein FliD [Campylobacterota bacterium]
MSDFGALSSLGAGSGVLTYDVIDKLKNADEATMITPLQTKLTNVQNKENALTDLTTQISLLKTSISDFKDGAIFQKRTLDTTGSSVTAKVEDGVAVQSISMDVTQLAQNDIYQSNGYDSKDSKINSTGSDQTIKLNYGGQETEITIKDGATLSDLKDAINDADIGVVASIIDTGSDDDPYKLVLKGNKTGADNIIKLDYGNIDDLGFNQTVYQSAEYSADTDKVNDSGDTQTFKITVNGTDYSMDLADGATVSDMVDAINNGELKDSDDNSLAGVSASFEDGHIKIHLQDIGDVSIDDTNLTTNMNDNTDFDANDNRVQEAQNSIFKYNGVEVERDSNEVTDLVVGLTMNLASTGKTTINIKQDTDSIEQSVQDFVSGYNSLVSKIQDLTKYDPDSKTTGLFQSESAIKSIPEDISRLLFSGFANSTTTKTDLNGTEYTANTLLNASDFGFTMNRTGFLDFDSTKFKDMLENKPDETEQFLVGKSDDDTDNGAFGKVLDYIDSLTKGSNSTLELLSNQYKKEEDSYEDNIKSNQEFIDQKYQIMAQQFASYDEMISSFNNQAVVLQQQIDAMIHSK